MNSKIKDHLDENNLHHAYLLEGSEEEILPEVLEFIDHLGIERIGNPDFYHIEADSFKIEDARSLRSFGAEKGSMGGKRIFIISANSFLLEAQNTLLKMFEEPTPNTYFFIIVPDANALLRTFISRFYLIKTNEEIGLKEADQFIAMPVKQRIDFVKELLMEDEEENEETVTLNSARFRALKFLNALESALHNKFVKSSSGLPASFSQIFKVRKFLRQPGSSAKSLMESVALVIPNF